MQRNFAPDKVFLLAAAVFGLALLLIVPPFQVEDEGNHFWHAYALSQGRMLPEQSSDGGLGATMPRSVRTLVFSKPHHGIGGYPNNKVTVGGILGLLDLKLNPDDRVFVDYRGVAFYSPVPYVAPAIGIGIGRYFDAPPLVLLYMARLFGFALWTALMWLAIRIAPFHKWVFALLALLPISFFQGVGVTADSCLAGCAFLTIALFLRAAYGDRERLGTKELAAIFASCLALALSKQSYFFLPALYFLIPVSKFGGRKRYVPTTIALFGIVFLALYFWGRGTNHLLAGWNEGVDPKRQLAWALSHPFQYFRLAIATILREQSLAKFLGRLGWEDFGLPEVLVWLQVGTVILVALSDRNDAIRMPLWHRLAIAALCFASLLLYGSLLYLVWNPVGNPAIRGIQHGRYFIPLLPLVFLPLFNVKPRGNLWVVVSLIVTTIWALRVVAMRYYG
jgi:uncharacterized membrane protein